MVMFGIIVPTTVLFVFIVSLEQNVIYYVQGFNYYNTFVMDLINK